ncbi:solute carrier family 23 member 2-like [Haliotis rufescens]|uniref:solute carrier family 23 member 2-like n=1 Tax=Haliotis rufescens TaxID=6454 RepID=UPI00201F2F4D|nr:solute carrier family 23 member 2-like [Haliotis rufescens]XP_048249191.1 solute carrier family 23 member 2-like [Haliotis rufescens]
MTGKKRVNNGHDLDLDRGEEKLVDNEDERLHYTLIQNPPCVVLFSAALQHIMMNLAFTVATAFIISDAVCAAYDSPIRSKLLSSTLLMSGLTTLLQTVVGIRLPIYQGPSASFFPALLALQNNPEWKCHDGNLTSMAQGGNTSSLNGSATSDLALLSEEEKLKQLSGSLMTASILEIVIGSTGLVGVLLRYIGPLTIAPTIALIGISLYKIPIAQSRPSWEISFGGIALLLIFILYIPHVKIPLPRRGKTKRSYLPLFQLFPVLLSILVMWAISAILTITDVFPNDPENIRYKARTDVKMSLIERTPWFYFPYPGQFGLPLFSPAVFVGFLSAFCASMIESVGDYFATAKACQIDPPPDHAVNRGILVEGLCGLLGGAIGTGHATTSYSGNIAAISVSKTASRSVMLCCGFSLVLMAVFGKFGAAIATVPDPTLAGTIVVLSGMLVAIGLSTLSHVNLNSSRNMTILGVSLFFGIFLPEWVDRHSDFIDTGVAEVDGVLKVALGTPMFVGGLLSIVLDTTVKGTPEDRGLVTWRKNQNVSRVNHGKGDNYNSISAQDAYEWCLLPRIYHRLPLIAKLPFMPSLTKSSLSNHTVSEAVELNSTVEMNML